MDLTGYFVAASSASSNYIQFQSCCYEMVLEKINQLDIKVLHKKGLFKKRKQCIS